MYTVEEIRQSCMKNTTFSKGMQLYQDIKACILNIDELPDGMRAEVEVQGSSYNEYTVHIRCGKNDEICGYDCECPAYETYPGMCKHCVAAALELLDFVNDDEDDDVPVFLISLKAGGTGLNLTAASIVIHFDPWWNIAAQNQATDRAHRIGQTNQVVVFKLIAKGTIEEKIIGLQEEKSKLASQVLDAEGISAATLSKEDFMEILRTE